MFFTVCDVARYCSPIAYFFSTIDYCGKSLFLRMWWRAVENIARNEVFTHSRRASDTDCLGINQPFSQRISRALVLSSVTRTRTRSRRAPTGEINKHGIHTRARIVDLKYMRVCYITRVIIALGSASVRKYMHFMPIKPISIYAPATRGLPSRAS